MSNAEKIPERPTQNPPCPISSPIWLLSFSFFLLTLSHHLICDGTDMLQNQIGLSVCDYIIKRRRTKSGESEEKSRGAVAFRFSCDFRSALTQAASDSRVCVCVCVRLIQQGRYLRRAIVHTNRHTGKQVCTYKEAKEDLAKSDAERRSRPFAMPARLNYSPPRAHAGRLEALH